MLKPTILVLFGGCSSEHTVSLSSACAVLGALKRRGYPVLPVAITPEGAWFYYTGPLDAIERGTWSADAALCLPCLPSLTRGENYLYLPKGEKRSYDAVFPVLHGKNGEDGTVQGLFELAGAPVIGCGVLSSALCMDKDRSHKIASQAGVRVPESAVFQQGDDLSLIEAAAEKLGYPLFVKPVRGGSSIGITKVLGPSALSSAVTAAFELDGEILLEKEVPGFEVGCAVLGTDSLTTGQPDEIELGGAFFGFEEKYSLKTSRIHCPARVSPEKAAEIQETAKLLFRAFGCRVCARVDFFLTPQGELVFNEVNTIPGFTAHSRYPGMMRAVGIGFDELIEKLVSLGVQP
ncbi:MAG: D-alanine--D-alanine ligase family protein [Oscillospiraceae bacterium]|nr:D-alanine--D-alanine ligase family protein [Oscillospiraceae bacterium]